MHIGGRRDCEPPKRETPGWHPALAWRPDDMEPTTGHEYHTPANAGDLDLRIFDRGWLEAAGILAARGIDAALSGPFTPEASHRIDVLSAFAERVEAELDRRRMQQAA